MSSSSGLIQKGSFANRKEFPWMAIIEGNFRTSGPLISRKHVLSIISSVADWDGKKKIYVAPASADKIKITLGAIRTDDENSIKVNISKVVLHSDFAFADNLPVINIAIVVLDTLLNFNENIKPICLWSLGQESRITDGSALYAVGYGNGNSGESTNTRKYAKMTKVSENECKAKFDGQKNFMKESKTFCAVGSDQGQPCHQDESIFMKFNGRWFFRGFSVTRITLPNNPDICALEPILYEDAAQYTQWLQSFLID